MHLWHQDRRGLLLYLWHQWHHLDHQLGLWHQWHPTHLWHHLGFPVNPVDQWLLWLLSQWLLVHQ